MNTFIWIAVIIAVYFFLKLFDPKKKEKSVRTESTSNDGESKPEQLLDLDKTTLADRQRAYGRGYRTQMRYDILQRHVVTQPHSKPSAPTLTQVPFLNWKMKNQQKHLSEIQTQRCKGFNTSA